MVKATVQTLIWYLIVAMIVIAGSLFLKTKITPKVPTQVSANYSASSR